VDQRAIHDGAEAAVVAGEGTDVGHLEMGIRQPAPVRLRRGQGDSCPYAPVSGHDAIRETVEGYFSGGTCVNHEILFIATAGDVVLMERIDHWKINGKTMDIPHMGICEVKDQKIAAWREYFTPSGDS